MQIITNWQPRSFIYWHDLTESEGRWFDYAGVEEDTFFRYKGEVYSLSDFMTPPPGAFPKFWHAYDADSFFSGILLHFCNQESGDYDIDNDVVVGTYIGD